MAGVHSDRCSFAVKVKWMHVVLPCLRTLRVIQYMSNILRSMCYAELQGQLLNYLGNSIAVKHA